MDFAARETLLSALPLFDRVILFRDPLDARCVSSHRAAKRTPVKELTYESGMNPIGDARRSGFDVKFYLH